MLGETFSYRDRALHCEDVALADVARRFGTPCYVYSRAGILARYHAWNDAFGAQPHLVCYAVKALSNLAVLRLLAGEGAGFDIVSGGELYRVLQAGGDPGRVVYSGVGKSAGEIEYALEAGIHAFHCESGDEAVLIDSIAARLGRRARIAFRVNPDIDAGTHHYISTGLRENKFGVDIAEAPALYAATRRLDHLDIEGVSCHIGSQILDTAPLEAAAARIAELALSLRAAGFPIRYVGFGGGLGVAYAPGDTAPAIAGLVGRLVETVSGQDLLIEVEPGRSIVASSGVLLTRVLYRKRNPAREFVVVDAAMTELIRPALYQAHHEIVPLRDAPERGSFVADVVGPVCETGDFLARDRRLPQVLPGDLLAVCAAGAYGFVQASNYNSRPRPPEVLVEGERFRLIRRRETWEDLVRGEE